MPQKVRTLELEVPDDFPAALFDTIHERVTSASAIQRLPLAARDRFVGAFNAVVYRFLACAEHVERFDRAIEASYQAISGRSTPVDGIRVSELWESPPPPQDRYAIEREIYDGWLTALAVHDSLCYALFVVGDAIRPDVFRRALKGYVDPKRTLKAYVEAFPDEEITDALHHALESMEFGRFSVARFALAPGAALGRTAILGRPSFRVGLQRYLLGEELTRILTALDAFTSAQFRE